VTDVLEDWRGSQDAMRWKPGPTAEEAQAALEHLTRTMRPVIASFNAQFLAMARALAPLARQMAAIQRALAEPVPSALDARYHQRQRNRRKRRR
jgi:hypothetical protein